MATVWSAMKDVVEVGDKVVKINGKPAGKYDFVKLFQVSELKEKKTKLTILTKDGEKVIVYQKNKIC
ncbi:MAG: hypothetical protein ACLUPL_14755 [Butyricimonas virosa]